MPMPVLTWRPERQPPPSLTAHPRLDVVDRGPSGALPERAWRPQRLAQRATVAGVVLRPQPVIGIGTTVVALILVRRRSDLWRTLALWTAALVALGFLLSHGIPTETARTNPYWGDGSADPLQWLGVGLIWACCATVAVFARQLPKPVSAHRARMTRGRGPR